MNRSTAPDKQALRKRVDRFFNSSTLYRKEVYEFVEQLIQTKDLNVYAFGGLVRDIGLFTVRGFESDVDLVVDTSKDELIKVLDNIPKDSIIHNKFGGFRIKQGSWSFDIWCAKDTWAIKNKLVTYKNIESLLDTTFLSWDSVLFDVKNKKLICDDNYIENLVNGKIDVVLRHTPNELGSLVRLSRAIFSKGVSVIGRNALSTLKQGFNDYSILDIIEYEKKSFSKKYLNKNNLSDLYAQIIDVSIDLEELCINIE
jgi:hypothetical protein